MTRNATPRRTAGTRQASSLHYRRLIGQLVPRFELAAEYVVLAALLHHPDLAAPHLNRLTPADWTLELHQVVARIALSHLRTLGRADMRQIAGVLRDARTNASAALALELTTVTRVAELIRDGVIVTDAVAAMTAHRQPRRGVAA